MILHFRELLFFDRIIYTYEKNNRISKIHEKYSLIYEILQHANR